MRQVTVNPRKSFKEFRMYPTIITAMAVRESTATVRYATMFGRLFSHLKQTKYAAKKYDTYRNTPSIITPPATAISNSTNTPIPIPISTKMPQAAIEAPAYPKSLRSPCTAYRDMIKTLTNPHQITQTYSVLQPLVNDRAPKRQFKSSPATKMVNSYQAGVWRLSKYFFIGMSVQRSTTAYTDRVNARVLENPRKWTKEKDTRHTATKQRLAMICLSVGSNFPVTSAWQKLCQSLQSGNIFLLAICWLSDIMCSQPTTLNLAIDSQCAYSLSILDGTGSSLTSILSSSLHPLPVLFIRPCNLLCLVWATISFLLLSALSLAQLALSVMWLNFPTSPKILKSLIFQFLQKTETHSQNRGTNTVHIQMKGFQTILQKQNPVTTINPQAIIQQMQQSDRGWHTKQYLVRFFILFNFLYMILTEHRQKCSPNEIRITPIPNCQNQQYLSPMKNDVEGMLISSWKYKQKDTQQNINSHKTPANQGVIIRFTEVTSREGILSKLGQCLSTTSPETQSINVRQMTEYPMYQQSSEEANIVTLISMAKIEVEVGETGMSVPSSLMIKKMITSELTIAIEMTHPRMPSLVKQQTVRQYAARIAKLNRYSPTMIHLLIRDLHIVPYIPPLTNFGLLG